MRNRTAALAAASLSALATAALASETTTYTYDALGRLTASTIAGGPNHSRQTATCFDRAGNRVLYAVATGATTCPTPAPSPTPTPGPTPTPSPTPSPTPTPTNTPPVAASDSTSFLCSANQTLNVLANDYDPDGNTPLSLVSVTSGSGSLWASISSGTSIVMGASYPGSYSLSYVIQDSLGATATGYVTVTVTGNPNSCQEAPPE